MTKYTIFYHASCADGFCAAWCCDRILKEHSPKYIPVQYGSDPDWEAVGGARVMVVDFSWPRDVLLRMRESAESLIVLDHHKTAKDELEGLDFCRFDMEKSGARLTWEWLREKMADYIVDGHLAANELNPPWLVQYTEDRDLWRFALQDSKEINAAIRLEPFTFEAWDKMDTLTREYQWFDRMTVIGGGALRETERIVKQHVQHAYDIKLGGHFVPCVNATCYGSEIGNELCQGRSFSVTWFFVTNGDAIVSLRSKESGIDVGRIAKERGGGGHPHAAVFKTSLIKWRKIVGYK